jgi:hypothetical protein
MVKMTCRKRARCSFWGKGYLDTHNGEWDVKTRLTTGGGAKSDMGTTTIFKPTAIQKKALAFLKCRAKHILLVAVHGHLAGLAK